MGLWPSSVKGSEDMGQDERKRRIGTDDFALHMKKVQSRRAKSSAPCEASFVEERSSRTRPAETRPCRLSKTEGMCTCQSQRRRASYSHSRWWQLSGHEITPTPPPLRFGRLRRPHPYPPTSNPAIHPYPTRKNSKSWNKII